MELAWRHRSTCLFWLVLRRFPRIPGRHRLRTFRNPTRRIDVLIDAAAKKAGVSREKYLEDQLSKRRGEITEAEIKKVYDDNRERVGASSLEDLRASITSFIGRNRDAQNLAALVDELKAAGPPVSIALDPPRYQVAIADHDPSRGPADASVTVVEFSEYQCPFCARVSPTLKQLSEKYGTKVRFVFKDFPLPNHQQAPKAAEAAHCAGDQGKYWELHDRLFTNQQQLQVPGAEGPCQGRGARSGGLRPVPRLGQARRHRAGGSRAGHRDGRAVHADALHQRPPGDRRAAGQGSSKPSSTKSWPAPGSSDSQVDGRSAWRTLGGDEHDLAAGARRHHPLVSFRGGGERQFLAHHRIQRP